jgi:hypothetical protein
MYQPQASWTRGRIGAGLPAPDREPSPIRVEATHQVTRELTAQSGCRVAIARISAANRVDHIRREQRHSRSDRNAP